MFQVLHLPLRFIYLVFHLAIFPAYLEIIIPGNIIFQRGENDQRYCEADIVGKVTGNIKAKELLQLRGDSEVTGNLYAGKLQVEPTAIFNGQCHMGTNVVEMNTLNEPQAIAK